MAIILQKYVKLNQYFLYLFHFSLPSSFLLSFISLESYPNFFVFLLLSIFLCLQKCVKLNQHFFLYFTFHFLLLFYSLLCLYSLILIFFLSTSVRLSLSTKECKIKSTFSFPISLFTSFLFSTLFYIFTVLSFFSLSLYICPSSFVDCQQEIHNFLESSNGQSPHSARYKRVS